MSALRIQDIPKSQTRACKDKNHMGKPCGNPANSGIDYCNAHKPKHDDEDDEIHEVEAIVSKENKQIIPEIRMVTVTDLLIDESYQRSMSPSKVRNIVKTGFNPLAAGTLTVNRRPNGELYVIDGRHRREAAKRSNISQVLCAIWDCSPSNESVAFLICNGVRKPPTALEMFKARLAANEPKAKEINTILFSLNLKLALKETGKQFVDIRHALQCINAIERCYDKSGPSGLTLVIKFIRDLWGNERNPYNNVPIAGLTIFFEKYKDEFSLEILSQRLADVPLNQLISYAKAMMETHGGRHSTNFARILVTHYNRGLRNRVLDIAKITNR